MDLLPEDIELRPITEYEAYVTRIRKFGDEMFEDMKSGTPPNEAIGKYNEKKAGLKSEFTVERTKDYTAVKKAQQMPQHEAQHEPVGMGEPRHTDIRDAEYKAPEDMIYGSHDFNIQSSYGDCHAYFYKKDEDGEAVVVRLTARARKSGRSHIVAIPIITWIVDPNEYTDLCNADFETLETLADDRNFMKFFK